MLGRLRLDPRNSRGRRFPEPAHPYRTDFQRDRDRIIHSRAFRRLEGKTQVFAPGLCDHFRNRLTHTLEVSQVARTAAATLGLNEEYTETLALAHDLGHPPFGHAGEKELDRQMRRLGGSFEHNRHALRITDLLEERYARFMERAAAISAGRLARRVGLRTRVLVDAVGNQGAIARSEADAPEIDGVVRIAAAGRLRPGDWADVEITASDTYDLSARLDAAAVATSRR